MQSNVKFVTDGCKVYRLAGNACYAVMEDNDRVMLVDTDCKIDNEDLRTPWSNNDCKSADGKNGQAILDYCNNLVNTYFSNIKYAIVPRNVEAGAGKIESAYMWPMSFEEFHSNKVIGGKIFKKTRGSVWTRTFSGIVSYNGRYAWYVNNSGGGLIYSNVSNLYCVAPAFNLKKSSIDYITEEGEIVLKPANTDITD